MLWIIAFGVYAYVFIAKPQYRNIMYPLTGIIIVGLAIYTFTTGVVRNGLSVAYILLAMAFMVKTIVSIFKRK